MGSVVPLKKSANSAYLELKNLLNGKLSKVEDLILRKLKSDVDLIEKMTNHHLNSGGKRLRALLTLQSAKLTGYKDVFICGGGANNDLLMDQLYKHSQINIHTTEYLGIMPELIEPAGFAWLARQSIKNIRLNYKTITGAKKENILGVVVHP